MILILSDHADFSTNLVVKWLEYYKVKWIRINETDAITFRTLEYNNNKISKFIITVNNIELNLAEIDAYWYRRGRLNFSHQKVNAISDNAIIQQNISMHLVDEIQNIRQFVYKYLYDCKTSINSFLHSTNDKSYYQFVAAEVGLNVPDTLICTSKQDLIHFSRRNSKLICKSINELFSFQANNNNYFSTTYLINQKDIEESEAYFSPSLFQEYIEKFIEIRSFYLKGKICSMAIFSQQNEKTKIDFREYDNNCPNRNVPFQNGLTDMACRSKHLKISSERLLFCTGTL